MVTFVSMKKTFGEWLKEEIDELRISQTELAKMVGVQPAQISRIISGERGTTPEVLEKVASILRLPPDHVFQIAGILPAKPKANQKIEQIPHLAADLPEEEQEYILEVIEARLRIIEQKARYETERKTRMRAASSEGD